MGSNKKVFIHSVLFGTFCLLLEMPIASAAPVTLGNQSGVTLSNGVIVTTECKANNGTPSESIDFSANSSHTFYGYGINISLPGKQSSVDRIVNNVKSLNLHSIRVDFGNPFRASLHNPAPTNVSDDEMYDKIKSSLNPYLAENPYIKQFYDTLRTSNVKVLDVMFQMPDNYRLLNKTDAGSMDPDHMKDYAQFYIAYLRVLNDSGLLPDMVELVNEPDGTWNPHFEPEQFEEFTQLVMSGVKAHDLHVNIVGPGTSNIPSAPQYLKPYISHGIVAGLSAISAHVYFTPNHFVAGTINSTQAPDSLVSYADIARTAKGYGKALIMTEFGGMDNANNQAPDPALDLKAALDLVRNGASVAMVWGLTGDKYSILDKTDKPLGSYFALQSLTTKYLFKPKSLRHRRIVPARIFSPRSAMLPSGRTALSL